MSNKRLLFALALPFLMYGIDSNINSFKKVEGLESCFYSQETGSPYLRLKYSDISTVRPKLGFLKFGIAFLKIEEFSFTLDLKESNSKFLFSKWNKISNQKAIKYATMEPISVSFLQLCGNKIILKAPKGKFSVDGGLKLWGKVECKFNRKMKIVNEVSIYFDSKLDSLVMVLGKDSANPKIIPFKK